MDVISATEEPPRIDSQLSEKSQRVEPSNSPPPNCAICLGSCVNKCFTDNCLHQFCFDCLLEWSKRKPVCPLCKQPFKMIIYNIRSNTEYERHIIPPQPEHIIEDIPEEEEAYDNFFLPNGPRPQRHFRFRTTLTLDPDGEVAIQQLLLSHPSTISLFLPGLNRLNRNPQQTLGFRRAIYRNGWWALANTDVTGRHRECSPNFFRENPAQMHRITPWLNRELGAIISDYVDIYVAQQTIMESLCEIPVQSREFKNRIIGYFRDYTDHFIHEFYNFLRSPYDMIGYDQNVSYSYRRPDNIPVNNSISDSDDSDVRVVDSPNDCIYVEPRTPEVIVIHSDNSDSDVIFRTPTPPVVVDLVNTDTEDDVSVPIGNEVQANSEPRLPLKMRFKLTNNLAKKKKFTKRKRRNSSESDNSKHWSIRHSRSSSSSSSSSSEYSNESESNWTPVKSESRSLILKRSKAKKKDNKKLKRKYDINRFVLKTNDKKYKSYSSSSSNNSSSSNSSKLSDSSDSDCRKKKKYYWRKDKQKKCKRKNNKKRYRKSDKKPKEEITTEFENVSETEEKLCKEEFPVPQQELRGSIPLSTLEGITLNKLDHKTDDYNPDVAGPSSSKVLPSVIVKGNKSWYSRPEMNSTSSDDSD